MSSKAFTVAKSLPHALQDVPSSKWIWGAFQQHYVELLLQSLERKKGWETRPEPNLQLNVWFESIFHSHLAVTTGNKSLGQPKDNTTAKKQTVTLEIQLLMDSLSRSKVPIRSKTGTRRPLDLKAISVLLLVYGRVRSCNTLQPKNDWVLRNTAIFFVKFSDDAYGWIMMQAKVKQTQPRSWLLPRDFPARAPKPFIKVKEATPISYPASDRLRAVSLSQAPSSGSQNGSCRNIWEWN